MKKLLSITVLVSLVAFTSCKKDNDDKNKAPTSLNETTWVFTKKELGVEMYKATYIFSETEVTYTSKINGIPADEESGTYTYKAPDGKKATIGDVIIIMHETETTGKVSKFTMTLNETNNNSSTTTYTKE